MKNIFRLLFFIITISFMSNCSGNVSDKEKEEGNGITLVKKHDSLYYIQIKSDSLIDSWELKYPVYQYMIGDVDTNGKKDILVGVIKTTRFDSIKRKRLFIFKNYKGYVRPLWLGSRLGKPLVDFNFIKSENGSFIRSIEKEKSGKLLIAEQY